MSNKPEEVTAEAWEIGCSVFADIVNEGGNGDDRETIARAIMAATAAEREAILQFEFDLPIQRNGADMMIAIREYIRSRTPS